MSAVSVALLLAVPAVRRIAARKVDHKSVSWLTSFQVSVPTAIIALTVVQQLSGPSVIALDLIAIIAVMILIISGVVLAISSSRTSRADRS